MINISHTVSFDVVSPISCRRGSRCREVPGPRRSWCWGQTPNRRKCIPENWSNSFFELKHFTVRGLFFHIIVFSSRKIKLTGFKLRISGVGNNHSTNWAIPTTPLPDKFVCVTKMNKWIFIYWIFLLISKTSISFCGKVFVEKHFYSYFFLSKRRTPKQSKPLFFICSYSNWVNSISEHKSNKMLA